MTDISDQLNNINFDSFVNMTQIPLSNFPTGIITQKFPINVYLSHIDDDNNQLAASWENNSSIIWQRSNDSDFWKIIYILSDNSTDEIFPKHKIRFLHSCENGKYIFIAFVNSYDSSYRDLTNIKYTVIRSENYGLNFSDITNIINSDSPISYGARMYQRLKYALKGRYIYKAILGNNFYIFKYDLILNKLIGYAKQISLTIPNSTSLYNVISFFDIDPSGTSMVLGLSYFSTNYYSGRYDGYGGIFYTFDISNCPPLVNPTYGDFMNDSLLQNIKQQDAAYYSCNLYNRNKISFPENFQGAVSNDGKSVLFYDLKFGPQSFENNGHQEVIIAPRLINSIGTNIFFGDIKDNCYRGIGSLSFNLENNIIISRPTQLTNCSKTYTTNGFQIYILNGISCVNSSNNYLCWNFSNIFFGNLQNLNSAITSSNIFINSLANYVNTNPNVVLNFYNDGTFILNYDNKTVIATGIPINNESIIIKNINLFTVLDPKMMIFNSNSSFILSNNSNNELILISNLMNSSQYNNWCRKNCPVNSNLQCPNLSICLKQYKNYCKLISKYGESNVYPLKYENTDPRCSCIDTESIVDTYFNKYGENVKNLMLGNGNCVDQNCTLLRNTELAGEDTFPVNYASINCDKKEFVICNTNIEAGGDVNLNGVVQILQQCGESNPNVSVNTPSPVITNTTTTSIPTTTAIPIMQNPLVIIGIIIGSFVLFILLALFIYFLIKKKEIVTKI